MHVCMQAFTNNPFQGQRHLSCPRGCRVLVLEMAGTAARVIILSERNSNQAGIDWDVVSGHWSGSGVLEWDDGQTAAWNGV